MDTSNSSNFMAIETAQVWLNFPQPTFPFESLEVVKCSQIRLEKT